MYDDKRSKQLWLKYQILFIALFFFFFYGCAHRDNTSLPVASAAKLKQQTLTTQLAKEDANGSNHCEPADDQKRDHKISNFKPSIHEDVEDEFFDDEFDLLDDEGETKTESVPDPLNMWNKTMFYFNDKLYFWMLKPVTKAYKTVTPVFVRIGVKNFFYNITTFSRLVNCLLQGKGSDAGAELSRFLINTTFGAFGFCDPAKRYIAYPNMEDFGQTFGVYGIGNGFYIVWPFLGSSTLRDSVGMIGDILLNPVTYMVFVEGAIGIGGLNVVNTTSFRLGDYETLKEAAIDPYEAFRDVYLQYRNKLVKE